MSVGLAIGAVGLVTSLFGSAAAAEARRKAARAQAKLDFQRAEEVLDRNDINNSLLTRQAFRHQGLQRVQVAASGRAQDVTTLAMMEETYRAASEQIQRNTRAAEWEATALRVRAESTIESGEAVADAGMINAVGSFASGAADMYDNAPAGAFDGIGDFFASAPGNISDAISGVEQYYSSNYTGATPLSSGIASGNYPVPGAF